MPYVLVADDFFSLKNNLMKPFNKRNLTNEEMVYNKSVTKPRNKSKPFEILASRFIILMNQINLCPEKIITLVLTCSYLPYLLKHKKIGSHVQGSTNVENINAGELLNADWRSELMLLNLQLLN